VDLAYSNRNELTGVTRWNNVGGSTLAGTTSYSYDDAGRVTSIVAKNAASATVSYYNYLFDNADRVTQESWGSGASSGTHTYGYDTTNQLTSADGVTYAYDSNGNRTTQGTQTYQTGTSNRTTNDGTYTYTYDGEGNLTQKSKGTGLETWYYTYDQRNLLTSVRETTNGTTNEFAATYTYDALGRRVQQDRWDGTSTVTTEYAFDATGQVWAELNGSNAVQYRYLNGDGSTAVFARINVSGGTVAWVVQDRLGSVRDVTDATQVNDHVEYSAFGAIASETNSANGVSYGYTGLFQDRYTFQDFATNRVLDPTTAKWLQQDPIMFQAGDANLQRYVGNHPTNEIDPSGLQGRVIGPQILQKYIDFDVYTGWILTDRWIDGFVGGISGGASREYLEKERVADGDGLKVTIEVWGKPGTNSCNTPANLTKQGNAVEGIGGALILRLKDLPSGPYDVKVRVAASYDSNLVPKLPALNVVKADEELNLVGKPLWTPQWDSTAVPKGRRGDSAILTVRLWGGPHVPDAIVVRPSFSFSGNKSDYVRMIYSIQVLQIDGPLK
jgi:RHS repeat-associated protein